MVQNGAFEGIPPSDKTPKSTVLHFGLWLRMELAQETMKPIHIKLWRGCIICILEEIASKVTPNEQVKHQQIYN